MSGGYYNYIYSKEPFNMDIETLKQMSIDLSQRGYLDAGHAVKVYADLIDIYKNNLEHVHNKLQKMMHDFEWAMSSDTAFTYFDETYKDFLKNYASKG